MTNRKKNERREDITEYIDDDCEISITLDVKTNKTELLAIIESKKHGINAWSFQPIANTTGTFDVFKFKIGKRNKKGVFPFSLTSFDINAGIVKARFERKKD